MPLQTSPQNSEQATKSMISANGIHPRLKVPFWHQDLVAKYDYPILLLVKGHQSYFKQVTTYTGRSEADIRAELATATRGLLSVKGSTQEGQVEFNLLVGDIKVNFLAGVNEDGLKRLYPRHSYLARSNDRANGLQKGTVIEFNGIHYCTGPQTNQRFESVNSDFKLGVHVEKFFELLDSSLLDKAHLFAQGIEEEPSFEPSESQAAMLKLLEAFVDTEYDLECRAQAQHASYAYIDREAASVRHIRRQFFDITLGDAEYARLCTEQPKLLAIDAQETLGEDVSFEVVDFEPISERPVVRLSPTQQADIRNIPASGQLKTLALPTLRNVRMNIIEQLGQGKAGNPWLLPLLGQEHHHQEFVRKPVSIDSGDFPPTLTQQAAIEAGIATPDYSLVLGPPGTGKTTVILEWVRYFVAQGKRILVTSQNNKAVDNVLERLISEPGFECLRIGNETKISSALSDVLLDNKAAELQQQLFGGNDLLFDYVDNALTYIGYLQTNTEAVLATYNHCRKTEVYVSNAQADVNRERNRYEGLLKKFNQAQKQRTAQQQAMEDLIQREPKGFMKVVTGPFYWLAKRRLTKQIDSAKEIEAEQQQSLDESLAALNNFEVALKDKLSQQAVFVEQWLSIESRHPGNYQGVEHAGKVDSAVPMIRIPTINELLVQAGVITSEADERTNETSSAPFLASLEALRDNLRNLKQAVARWFEKIRNEREQSLYPLLLEKVNVVGATCIGINTKALFRNIDFDVVIVDEAGQIQVHNLIVPLSRCDKAILVGDHKQIRPIVNDDIRLELDMQLGSDSDAQYYEKSWFEILWERAPDSRRYMLDTQFRCPSEISDFVSKAFYENQYYAGENKKNSKPLLKFCPSPMIWLDTSVIKNNHEQRKQKGFNGNMTETNIVVEVLRRAIAEQPELLAEREIGIIVPYRVHVEQIKRRIKTLQQKHELPDLEIPLNELVASVDSFQGQERKLIIFACSRSNKYGNVGFLRAWQRVNVAVTRAKRQLIIIGNSDTLSYLQSADAPDKTFKQAMQQLVKQVEQAGALLPGFRFLPRKPKQAQNAEAQKPKMAKTMVKQPQSRKVTES